MNFIEVKIKPEWKGVKSSEVKDRLGYDKADIEYYGKKAVSEHLSSKLIDGDGYDLIFKNKKISVISQSARVEASIFQTSYIEKESRNQNCDIYVFIRILVKDDKLWIGGWLPRDVFWSIARFNKAGKKSGCVTTLEDGWRVYWRMLFPMENLESSITSMDEFKKQARIYGLRRGGVI